MADSKRELIVAAIKTRFETITVANGYETNLGSNTVDLWRVTKYDDDELSTIGRLNFGDTEETTEQLASNVHDHRLKIECRAIAIKPSGMAAAKYGRKILADLRKAVGADRTFSGTCRTVLGPMRGNVIVEHDIKIRVGVEFDFECHYRTVSFDPYTAA